MNLDPEAEARIFAYEQAWRRLGTPAIEDFLGDPFDVPSPRRTQLLVELIAVDLEFRDIEPDVPGLARLAAYLGRFPDLGPIDGLPADLITEEYRARRWRGDRPPHADFLAPFVGEAWERVRAELIRVDAEFAEEGPDLETHRPGPIAVDSVPDVPLLSDRDFLLRRLVGAGRSGKVYQASRRDGGPDVAVKFLRKTLLGDPGVVRRFLGEARTVLGLRHPNIVATHGLGQTAGGSYFLVMDLVDGPDLARRAAGTTVTEAEAIAWGLGICEALAHAHAMGVVHCDLKPANLLLDPSGRVRVADFGLARSLALDAAPMVGIEGTAPFMAPEQVSPAWGPIGPQTDVYGLGAVLFTLLTGRAPHVGQRMPDILAQVVTATPVDSPDQLRPGLSEPLVDLCRRCLAKPPEGRYRDIGEVLAALTRLSDGLISNSHPEPGRA